MTKPPARLGLVVWLLGFWCAGCSGTPLGEQLAERLSEPDNPVEETTLPDSAAAASTGEPLTEQPSEPGDPEVETSLPNPPDDTAVTADPLPSPAPDEPPANASQEASSPGSSVTTQSHQPLNPTPYRLLLRLPAADPAAPAEAVTQALRAAGILFEVETIERLSNPPTSPAPSP